MNTEPAYLKGLLASVDNRAVAVKIKICAQDPVSVVRHTVAERDKAGDHYHQAWCVLDVDELDSSLHPRLSAFLVGLFQDPDRNPHGAQLLFTSHDVRIVAPGGRSLRLQGHRAETEVG